MEYDPTRYHGKGTEQSELSTNGSALAIDSSNKGFQLLKKHGWKEGTGLGISEQGRLEPVETHVKNNKRGVGADKGKEKIFKPSDHGGAEPKNGNEHPQSKKKKGITKKMRKKMRKMQELEKKLRETEFQRAFFREFW